MIEYEPPTEDGPDPDRLRDEAWDRKHLGGIPRSSYEATGKLCQLCGERFKLEHENYCSGCLIHAEDAGDPACDACGSTLDWTGGCGCDLPPAGDSYWHDKRF